MLSESPVSARGVLLSLILLTSGCAEVTRWDAQGSWSGRVTLPGEVEAERESGLSDPGEARAVPDFEFDQSIPDDLDL